MLLSLPSPLRDIIDSHPAIECFSLYSDFNIGALFEVKFVNSCTIYIRGIKKNSNFFLENKKNSTFFEIIKKIARFYK